MSVNNTGVRADSPRPTTPSGAGAAARATFVPSNTPNNPSRDNKGDALGNATVSLLRYVFEVLPGRATGALAPVASDAQTRTPQLMASVHAQDAVAANQSSWDSGLWVTAGDAFMTAWNGLEGVIQRRDASVDPAGVGVRRVESKPQLPAVAPRATLRELEDRLSRDFIITKSKALIDYQRMGGNDGTGLVVLLGDASHADDAVQALLDKAVKDNARPDLGDRGLFESVGGTDKQKLSHCRTLPPEHCNFFSEPSSSNDIAIAGAQLARALKDMLLWLSPRLRDAGATEVSREMRKLAADPAVVGHSDGMYRMSELLDRHLALYEDKLRSKPREYAELVRRYQQRVEYSEKFHAAIHAANPARDESYWRQLRQAAVEGSNAFSTIGSGHTDVLKPLVQAEAVVKMMHCDIKVRPTRTAQ